MKVPAKSFIKGNGFYCFLFISSLIAIGIHPNHSLDYGKYNFFDTVRLTELGFTIFLLVGFYTFYLKPTAKYQIYYGGDGATKSGNKFYCNLMLLATVVFSVFTIHYINWKTNDVDKAIKLWEIVSYMITLVYTWWFWYFSENGTKTLDLIEVNEKRFAFKKIVPALGALIAISILQTIIIFGGNLGYLTEYSLIPTLFLIVCVYITFNYINDQVIKKTSPESTTHKDFCIMRRYVDKPNFYVFGILLGYATYTIFVKSYHRMEFFFSGAIAFELILSSIVWSKTETV